MNVKDIAVLFNQLNDMTMHRPEPVVTNPTLNSAGKRTEVSMAIAIAFGDQIKSAMA
jgi:hypothetical protein